MGPGGYLGRVLLHRANSTASRGGKQRDVGGRVYSAALVLRLFVKGLFIIIVASEKKAGRAFGAWEHQTEGSAFLKVNITKNMFGHALTFLHSYRDL